MKRSILLILMLISLWQINLGQMPELVVQTGHSSGIKSVIFSPDGQFLVSNSQDNTAKLWDVKSGAELRNLTEYFATIHFSPNGKFLITDRGLIDVQSGKEVRKFKQDIYFTLPLSSALSKDGNMLAICGMGLGGVLVNDLKSEKQKIIPLATPEFAISVAFSPDGTKLAIGSSKNAIKIFDVSKWKFIQALIGHSERVVSVVFSLDGKFLASASGDETVKLT